MNNVLLSGGEGAAALRQAVNSVVERLESRLLFNGIQANSNFGVPVTTGFGLGTDAHIVGLTVESSGKILAVGETNVPSQPGQIALAQYNSDGTLDTTWGPANASGAFTTPLAANTATSPDYEAKGKAVFQPDGMKFIVPGQINGQFTVFRYNADGTVDTSLGGGTGYVTVPLTFHTGDSNKAKNQTAAAYEVVIEADNSILAGGRITYSNDQTNRGTFVLAHLSSTGILDSTFGNSATPGIAIFGQLDSAGNQLGGESTTFAVEPGGNIIQGGDASVQDPPVGLNVTGNFAPTLIDYSSTGQPLPGTGTPPTGTFSPFGSSPYASSFESNGTVQVNLGRRQDDPQYDQSGVGNEKFLPLVTFEQISGMQVQSNGDIVLTGTANQYQNRQQYSEGVSNQKLLFAVRLLPSGAVDTTFGGNTTIPGAFGPQGLGVEVVNVGQVLQNSGNASYQNAELNFTDSAGTSSTLEPDGKILVAGDAGNESVGSNIQPMLVRLNTDGSLDKTFGVDGVLLFSSNPSKPGSAPNQSVAIQPTDTSFNIVVGGTTNGLGIGNSVFALYRFDANGNPDPTFGGGSLGGNVAVPSFVVSQSAVQANGQPVSVGSQNGVPLLARFNNDGSLDETFGSGGTVPNALFGTQTDTLTFSGTAKGTLQGLVNGNAFAVSLNGTTIAQYTISAATPATGLIANLQSQLQSNPTVTQLGIQVTTSGDQIILTGAPRRGFHTAVSATEVAGIDPTASATSQTKYSGTYTVTAVAIQSDGKILVAGADTSGDFAVARYNPDGTADTTFGPGDGSNITLVNFPGGGTARASSITVDANQDIVVVGTNGSEWALARLASDGVIDTSFSGGSVVTNLGGGDDVAAKPFILDDGSILVSGTYSVGSNQFAHALARYNADGSPFTGFANNGVLLLPSLTAALDTDGSAAEVDDEGRLLVAGGSADGFALSRFFSNGSPDTSFGTGGTATQDPLNAGAGDDADSMIVQDDSRILVVGTSAQGTTFSTVVTSFTFSGATDPTFPAETQTSDLINGTGRAISLGGGNRVTTPATPVVPPGGRRLHLPPSGGVVILGSNGTNSTGSGTELRQTTIPAVSQATTNPVSVTAFPAFSTRPVIGGSKGRVLVRLTNSQATLVSGIVQVNFFLSTDGTVGGEVANLGSLAPSLRIAHKVPRVLAFNFNYPVNLANGSYFVVADVTPLAAGEADNVSASASSISISKPFVDLAALGFAGNRLTFKAAQRVGLNAILQNLGNISANGPVTVSIYSSADGSFNPDINPLLASVTRTLVIPAKGKRAILQALTLPAGSYSLVLQVKLASDNNPANDVFFSPVITVT